MYCSVLCLIYYDKRIIEEMSSVLKIPLVCLGGVGHFSDFKEGIDAGASGVSAANIFQHLEHSTILAKAHLLQANVDVRLDTEASYDYRAFDNDGRLIMLDHSNISK